MRYLRTNTAVIVSVGPFLDKADGFTLKTALTITNEKITLVADTDAGSAPTLILDNITGATSGTANDLNYITGQDNAMMQMELAAADVNRLGRMRLTITDAANHLPVIEDFMVVPQAIFDWFIAGTVVPLPANVTTWLGTAAATPDTAGYPKTTIKAGTGTGEINLASGAVPVKGNIKKNTAFATFEFMMTDSTNHAPVTGKTVTCTRSIDGGAFGAGTLANIIEVGNGIYAVDFATGDLNGNNIIMRATASGCDDTYERIVTYLT